MRTLGIDLGGTFARAAVVDEQGQIVSSAKTALGERKPESVIEAIALAARGATDAAGGAELGACGVGVAGQLGPGGVVRVGPNLGWRNVPFGQLLAQKLGRPVTVVNDLAAAAWGEFKAGAGRGVMDTWVVFVGSGVGSAVISGGRHLRGATGIAGEVGHTKVVAQDGRLCGCGERGCLEAYAGGHNLIRQMVDLVNNKASPALAQLSGGDSTKLTPALLEQAAAQNDPAAAELYERTCAFLGMAIANQITVLNPARVILGGGVLLHAPGIKRRIEDGVRAWTNANARAAVAVVDAALGDDSGLIGAALLAAESP